MLALSRSHQGISTTSLLYPLGRNKVTASERQCLRITRPLQRFSLALRERGLRMTISISRPSRVEKVHQPPHREVLQLIVGQCGDSWLIDIQRFGCDRL